MYLLYFFLISRWTVLFKSLNLSMFSCVLQSFIVLNSLSLCLIKRLIVLRTHGRRCCFLRIFDGINFSAPLFIISLKSSHNSETPLLVLYLLIFCVHESNLCLLKPSISIFA